MQKKGKRAVSTALVYRIAGGGGVMNEDQVTRRAEERKLKWKEKNKDR
jgi:hypothetical protein